jgi:hypothetical protein
MLLAVAVSQSLRGGRCFPRWRSRISSRGHGPAWRRANAGHVSLGQLKVLHAPTPQRGLDCFLRTRMDVLVMGVHSLSDR